MRLSLVTDRRELVEVVLASDPSVAAANRGNPLGLIRYRYTDSDPAALQVPDDATLVRFLPIQDVDRKNAGTYAGRTSETGRLLYAESVRVASEAHAAAVQAATLANKAPPMDTFARAQATFIDGLPDADADALRKYREWQAKRAGEVVRRAVQAVVVGTDANGTEDIIEAGPKGFPVEAFTLAVDVHLRRAQADLLQARAEALGKAATDLRAALDGLGEARSAAVEAITAGRVQDAPEDVRAALAAQAEAEGMAWMGATSAAEIIEEIADHIERVSSLGKGGRTCSSTRSGAGTGTT